MSEGNLVGVDIEGVDAVKRMLEQIDNPLGRICGRTSGAYQLSLR